jgi:hypothetical protein
VPTSGIQESTSKPHTTVQHLARAEARHLVRVTVIVALVIVLVSARQVVCTED